jgi:peptide/nickel transport system substrate-binding protein
MKVGPALTASYGEKPRYGGTFQHAIHVSILCHDIQQCRGGFDQVGFAAYNNLIMSDPYGWQKIIPDLAHAWESGSDLTKWTFHLNKDVKFHDGTPFTSADAKYNAELIKNNGRVAGNDDEGSYQSVMWLALVESIEAPDPNTIVYNLKGSSPAILNLLSDGLSVIVPKHISEVDPTNALRNDLRIIGTGPYKTIPDDLPTPELYKLEYNPDYFKEGLPYMDGIESHLILDEQVRFAALSTKKIFWNGNDNFPLLSSVVAKSMADRNAGLVRETSATFWNRFLAINSTRPPFDDIRVRQALSEGLDRRLFASEASFPDGLGPLPGVVGTSILPSGRWAMPKEMMEKLPGYGPNMEVRRQRARDLLAEYEAENGKINWADYPFNCATEHPSCDVAVIAQSQWKKIGVDMELDPGEIMVQWMRGEEGTHNMIQFNGVVDFDDPVAFFNRHHISGATWLHSHLSDPRIDALYEKQIFLADQEERKRIAWEIDTWATEQSAHLDLIWMSAEHLKWDFVKGWSPFPNYFSTTMGMEYVWLDLPELPFSR